ncbi:cell wall metabolism sensor histidine kinase WalK [Cryobacterium sp. TMS1-13-1]|uniref:sensor histidine kinase n=1 Tax=Cryobacterium sp. TMS1-13-1 TaxID=1259220 RepID=UPI00106CA9E1|nr:HAMP domain-containing sensor histidine kinase [Cryobacterium sp. TMS1-13-1]TFD21382.1 HAMP domain-containing histidine kinase [Cryobacterium sp. TMS1-13-1]
MFRRALVRLTVTYTIVQLVLFAAFAVGLYIFVTGTFDFDAAESDGAGALNAAEQGFANLRTGLIVLYAVLLVLIPIASFLMARAALAPLQKSYELQQRFVDGASHEMRSPLSVIQGELELALLSIRTPAEYERAMQTALDAVGGLTQLTNDLLLLSRGAGAELKKTYELVDLNDLVRLDIDARASSPVDAARLDVHLGRAAAVLGSPALLARAIANVIDNALKFTPPTGVITVSTDVHDSTGTVTVRDTGIGMDNNDLKHAFDRFWRSDRARSQPGHGIGLSLVEQIIHAHDGRITLTSQVGIGTTVTVNLPLRP